MEWLLLAIVFGLIGLPFAAVAGKAAMAGMYPSCPPPYTGKAAIDAANGGGDETVFD